MRVHGDPVRHPGPARGATRWCRGPATSAKQRLLLAVLTVHANEVGGCRGSRGSGGGGPPLGTCLLVGVERSAKNTTRRARGPPPMTKNYQTETARDPTLMPEGLM